MPDKADARSNLFMFRLAFSCIWELTPKAEIIVTKFTKSIICSRVSLLLFNVLSPLRLHVGLFYYVDFAFSALGYGCRFSHVWHRLRVFPCLALITCIRALETGRVFLLLSSNVPLAFAVG